MRRFAPILPLLTSLATAGTFTYTLETAANPTADQSDAYARIRKAMDSAVGYYNAHTGIRRHLNVQYEPSVATADGGGSNIRFGSSRSYMVVATAMHEISHTLGVGTSTPYAALVANGFFNGPLATAALRKIERNDTVRLHADRTHIWPYGLNYASEVKSTTDLVNHCKIMDALYQDLYHEVVFLEGRIRNVATRQCLSVTGTALSLGSCTDTTSFARIVALGETNPAYRVEWGSRVLDAPSQSSAAGLVMGTYTWNGGAHQQFRIEGSPLSSVKAYRLKMLHSGLYLHAAGNAVVQDALAAGTGFDWELIKGSVTPTGIAGPPAPRPAVGEARVDPLGRRHPADLAGKALGGIGTYALPD